MKNPQRIAVIMGGTSAEREISLKSGAAVARALEGAGRSVLQIDLGSGRDVLAALSKVDMDVAFLALHGRLGEDGCVQGLLEVLGVPYTGSSVLASALAMDKVKAKELFRLHNIATPPYYVVTSAQAPRDVREIHGSFGFPVIVKPRREGSSVGLAKANSLEELELALSIAFEHDSSVLVERFVQAREVAVGLLDGKVLGAIEIAPKKGIYDYEAKYTAGMTEYFLPARISNGRLRGVTNLAERAVQALDASGAVRVDLLVTEGQNEYVLEVNTLPGMTETSLLPKIAASAGLSFSELCEAMVESATLHSYAPTRPLQPRATEILADGEFGLSDATVADFELNSDVRYELVTEADMVAVAS